MLKLLYIGNSFSVDSLQYSAEIARDLGIRDVKIGNLMYPACSLKMHLNNVTEDAPAYIYYETCGDGWTETPNVSVAQAMAKDDWNIVGIFPGTGDGSAHSSHEAYERLPELVRRVREMAPDGAKLVYSLTWMSDKENPKKELALYNGDQELVMSMIADRIRQYVIAPGEFWKVVPTGAAVQNARNEGVLITRDGYHLSLTTGRYMAALTVIGAVTDADIRRTAWVPEGMTAEERAFAVRCARKALMDPYKFN